MRSRARSERDVRGFITTGLAIEQLRVGALLKDNFQVALEVDWQSQKVRRSLSPSPTDRRRHTEPVSDRTVASQTV